MENKVPIINSDILARAMGSDMVLLEPSSGKVFGLNTVGTSFWKAIDGKQNLTEIIAGLGDEYDVDLNELKRDVMELTSSLIKEDLLRLEEG